MISQYSKKELIYMDPAVSTKKELFRFFAEDLAKKGLVKDKKRYYNSLIEREKLGSTQITPHVAIPHAHCSSVNKTFIAVVISKNGIDFEHSSYGKANVIFLLGCASSNNKDYLQLLAATARVLKNPGFYPRVLTSSSEEEVLSLLKQFDPYDNTIQQPGNELLIITLYKKHRLADLLSALLEKNIGNAMVVDSNSLAKKVAYEIPVFAGLSLKNTVKDTGSTIVFATVTDKTTPKQLLAMLKEVDLDFEKPGNGYIQVFKVSEIIGHPDEFI